VIYRDPDTGRTYTYAQVKETAIDFGKGLKAAWDWQKGDVIGLFTPNSIDIPTVIWGIHWAGGVPSPANPGYTAAELAFQLKDSGAKALITQKKCLKEAREAAKIAGIPDNRIILIGDERDETSKFKHFTNIRNISGATRYRRTKSNPKKDLAFLVYSSGTTGHPKGVMLSHENIVSNVLMLKVGECQNLSWENDRLVSFLPFYHIYGMISFISKRNRLIRI
jgi:4-coumarate--CoA ligase